MVMPLLKVHMAKQKHFNQMNSHVDETMRIEKNVKILKGKMFRESRIMRSMSRSA